MALPQPSKDWLTLPNCITLFRIAGVPVLFVLMMQEYRQVSLAWFLLLVISDGLDGFIARRFQWVSELGITLDPFADKVLVAPLLWYFWAAGTLSDTRGCVFVILLTAREILVTTVRITAGRRGIQTPAQRLGKIKVNCEYISLMLLIADYSGAGEMALGWAVFFAIISLFQYIWTIDFLFERALSITIKTTNWIGRNWAILLLFFVLLCFVTMY